MLSLSNLPSTDEMKAIDLAHHWHPFTDMGTLDSSQLRVITQAEGVYIYDSDGRQILDGMAGLWCVNAGYGRQSIGDAAARQMTQLPYYNSFFKTSQPPVIALAEKLAQVSKFDQGHQLTRFIFGSGGSDSNDTIMRLVRTYWAAQGKPNKQTIIARKNSYHGSSVGAASLGGMVAMHEQGALPIPGIHHIGQPYWFDEGGESDPAEFGLERARQLEKAIDELGEDNVAAFIAEPIQGAGGVIIPPETYWPEIQRICDERDILLISDEVICGFGRLGQWFGAQHFGVRPDITAMAKGISSGYLPVGAVGMSEKVATGMFAAEEFYHGYTYSGHPACCAAAVENLAIMDREDLVTHVREHTMGVFAEKWAKLSDHPLVGEAATVGLLGKIELVPEKGKSRKRFDNYGAVGTTARDHAFSSAVIVRAIRDTLVSCPPLIISDAEIDLMVERVWKTLDLTMADVKDQMA